MVDANVPGNILNFGALSDNTDPDVELKNCQAFVDAVYAANNGDFGDDRRVLIDANSTISMMPGCATSNTTDVVVQIDGKVLLSLNTKHYPENYNANLFLHSNVSNLTYRGTGEIDGQGWIWWFKFTFGKNVGDRPKLVKWVTCDGCEFTGIKLKNSPHAHLDIRDCINVWVHDFEIEVDPWGKLFGIRLPWFGFNTDGVDIAATNALVERLNITCHDDAVVVKNGWSTETYNQCSRNLTIRDINTKFTTGMAIGSIPPTREYSCVDDVTFQNVKMHTPFKGIYVKTDPERTETNLTIPGSGGQISNVVYDNINIHEPLWWGIYIGPQQMKNPDGAGPGCILYPLKPCDCEPLVSMSNISLSNVQQHNTILPPGIVRCDETNPCSGFDWTNVTSDGWWNFPFSPLGFISDNIEGKLVNVAPRPGFKDPDSADAPLPQLWGNLLFNHFAEKLMDWAVAQTGIPLF